MSGHLYGLGIGPGDSDLITLKALKILAAVPVLAYPAPEGGGSLARAIAAPHIKPGAIEISMEIPMTPGLFPANASYDHHAATIAGHLDEGRNVAVLCEGDPFFYGSFMYLFQRLSGRYQITVVPGVSSLGACAAAARLPLVSRAGALAVLPAPMDETELETRIKGSGAVAIIKIGRHMAKVKRILGRLGLASRARYVEHATMTDERVLDLAEAPADGVPYFSMVLIGGAEMHRDE